MSDDATSDQTDPATPAVSAGPPAAGPGPERLHRSRHGRMIAGVADGLGDYFGIDTTLVRVAFVVLAVAGGIALPLYLAGWLLIPEEGSDRSLAEEFLGRHAAA